MKILNYKLSIRSPYDYFDEVSENLDLTEHQKEIFEAHMDYILSLVEFKDCTPEELFVYCFNTMFIDRKIQNLKLFNYINSLLRKYSSAFEKASLIKEYIMRMDEEGDEMEEIS